MGTLYKIGNKILKIGNKILTASDIPVPPLDYVTIGSQIWTSKNLSIDDGQGGIYTQTVNYGQGDVVEYYYTWDAAMRVAASVQGWHIPSSDDWRNLANSLGTSTAGTQLKSTYGWQDDGNGTDDYGFSAFPAGNWNLSSFYNLGRYASFWTSHERSSTTAYYRRFDTGPTGATSYSNNKTNFAYSVRLIKDSV